MDKNVRQKEMLDYVIRHQEVTIQSLSQMFNVHEMTIRRDLEELEKKYPIKRTHGGVISKVYRNIESLYNYRSTLNTLQKEEIASKAANLIDDGDFIFLDSGTTTLELAKLIINKNITVVINDFHIYDILKYSETLDILFASGKITKEYRYMTGGSLNEYFYNNLYANKAFLGVMAVDFLQGVYQSDLKVALSKRGMVRNAEQVYVMADTSKFDKKTSYKVCDIKDINYLITDSSFDSTLYSIPSQLNII